jgi:RHS repeat-associated protein
MRPLAPLRFLVAFGVAFSTFVAWDKPAWAQNENETVGFKPSHVYESGAFGENIDVLGGNLNLAIPLGPRYQVNDRLGYQLTLAYNSKVWDYGDYNNSTISQGQWVRMRGQGPVGTGFSLHFGRILQDAHWNLMSSSDGTATPIRTWSWVTPDGGVHDFWYSESNPSTGQPLAPSTTSLITTDLTYTQINYFPPPADGHFTVQTPDGLYYTLTHQVPIVNDSTNVARMDNLSYGGWYVTKIEDRSVVVPAGTPWPNVTIDYYDQANYQHVIESITDSAGRTIEFKAGVVNASGVCVEGATATDRHAVAICRILIPAFGGQEALNAGARAEYQLKYRLATVNKPDITLPGTVGPIVELTQVQFPAYTHPGGGAAENYRMFFGYVFDPTDYGELQCRTLPISAPEGSTCEGLSYAGELVFRYLYDYYSYQAVYVAAGRTHSWEVSSSYMNMEPTNIIYTLYAQPQGRSFVRSATTGSIRNEGTKTRQVIEKRILNLDPEPRTWTYTRHTGVATNPSLVTVLDPFLNETYYHFKASYPPGSSDSPGSLNPGQDPDDGLAPEWDDGLLTKVEYFKGHGVARQRIRTELKDYTADLASAIADRKLKFNARVRSETTIFDDRDGLRTTTAFSGWDGLGHWGTKSEVAFDVPGTRITVTHYAAQTGPVYITGLAQYVEVIDGSRVLRRTDNYFTLGGRIATSVQRKTVPATMGREGSQTAASGDVKTVYQYDQATGAITGKSIWSKGDGALADYCMSYGWSSGGAYLRTKQFKNCNTQALLSWKAIDRLRDGNTGLILATRDSGDPTLVTGYDYDALGRIEGIIPPAPEIQTTIHYESPFLTSVKRAASGTDYEYHAYHYDRMGRLGCEERRPESGTILPYQVTRYDVDGSVTFKGEWQDSGSCATPGASGTTFAYNLAGDFKDPFRRLHRVTTADGHVTTTTYQGTNSTTTIDSVAGAASGGSAGPVTTAYFRDGWGRLIGVLPQFTAAAGGAIAYYHYTLLDDLSEVTLVDQSNGNRQYRSFEYDALGRVFQARNPESGTVVYQDYDALGNLRSYTDASGSTIKSLYDSAGRPTLTTRQKYTDLPKTVKLNGYDQGPRSGGRLSSARAYDEDGVSVLIKSFSYDGPGATNGRLTTVISGFGSAPLINYATSFQYDNYGNVSQMTYPAGGAGLGGALTLTYIYSNNIPIAVREGAVDLASVSYNAAGAVMGLLAGAQSSRSEVEFDTQNRPKKITIGKWVNGAWASTPAPLVIGNYAYDGGGNISAIGPNANGDLATYGYDSALRLSGVHERFDATDRVQCFQYDGFGNMTGKVDRLGTTACAQIPDLDVQWTMRTEVFDGLDMVTNRMLDAQFGTGSSMAFTYDSKGNLIRDSERLYVYDSLNRMVNVGDTAGTYEFRHDYDTDGSRIMSRKRSMGQTTYFVRDADGKLLSEFRRSALGGYAPEWLKHHVYLAGKEVALRENRRPPSPDEVQISTIRNAGDSTILLKWKAIQEEGQPATYKVYRSTGGAAMSLLPGAPAACAGQPAYKCFTDGSLTSDVRFDYQVTSVNASGESYGSDIVWIEAGDITPPMPPRCLRATAGDQELRLTWQAGSSSDVLGYNVYYRKQMLGGIWGPRVRANDILITQTSFTLRSLQNSFYYRLYVQAVDHGGRNSDDHDNSDCGTPPLSSGVTGMPKDFAAPSPPSDVRLKGTCDVATTTVSWTRNPDSDVVTAYWVYRSPDFSPPGPQTSGLDPDGFPSTSFTDITTVQGSSYYYWVQAEDFDLNRSVSSMKVGRSTRSSLLPVPPGSPVLKARDGVVEVTFNLPASSQSVKSFAIYRKPNAVVDCGSFLQVGSIDAGAGTCAGTSTTCQLDVDCPAGVACQYLWNEAQHFVDSTAPNGLALDYAIVSRDQSGMESGLSQDAYAIPVAGPRDFRACVEHYPAFSGEPDALGGWVYCGSDLRRISLRWSDPPATPYQPITASNATGDLSYLLGYHALMLRRSISGQEDASVLYEMPNQRDASSTLTNRRFTTTEEYCGAAIDLAQVTQGCGLMGTCLVDGLQNCSTNADCATGTTCQLTCVDLTGPPNVCASDSNCGPACRSNVCSTDTSVSCTQSAQCPPSHCSGPRICAMEPRGINAPAQSCIQDADCPANATCSRWGGLIKGGQVAIPTDPYLLASQETVAIYHGLQIGLGNNTQRADCLAIEAVHKVYVNGRWETVLSSPSENYDPDLLTTNLDGSLARCRMWLPAECDDDSRDCASGDEPPRIATIPTVSATGPGRVQVSWQAPAGNLAGYQVFVVEISDPPIIAPNAQAAYVYAVNRPVAVVPASPTSYEISGLPTHGRGGGALSYQFRIAALDFSGRVGPVSPASASITPAVTTVPMGLKTVIWTTNDASVDGGPPGPSYGVPNPRSRDGVKLQWATAGNRLYRATDPGGPFCLIVKDGPGNPTEIPVCHDESAFSDAVTTGGTSSNTRFFHDTNTEPNVTYYYRVTNLSGGVESGPSATVAGMSLGYKPLPLSPPRHFKAWAVKDRTSDPDGSNVLLTSGRGVYLRWCPSPPEEGVTGYRIYRSGTKGGPYTRLTDIDNPLQPTDIATNCLMGSRRCEIPQGCTAPCTVSKVPSCSTGPGGTCKIVDLSVSQASGSLDSQVSQAYYYVVTALRGTEESAYSAENIAWPNYLRTDGTIGPRYDPDDRGDIACDDEMSELDTLPQDGEPETAQLLAAGADEESLAPYRVIGAFVSNSSGGVNGQVLTAQVRWLFMHTDHLGSPRRIFDGTGGIVSTHHFMPFGEEKPLAGRVDSNRSYFTGHQRDPEAATANNPDGLDYMLARYYSSSLGRFMAVDPSAESIVLSDPQSWNRYAYAANNPLRYVDPDGTHNEEGHTTLTNEALGGGCECTPATPTAGEQVLAANLGQDTFWSSIADTSAEGANQHGMAGRNDDGTWQTGEEAQAGTAAFIDGQVGEAATLALSGDIVGARAAEGRAGHAAQDSSADSHVGGQRWKGLRTPPGEAIRHKRNDKNLTDRERSEGVAATRAVHGAIEAAIRSEGAARGLSDATATQAIRNLNGQ